MFGVARQSKKEKIDVMRMPCIYIRDGRLMVTSEEKIKVWKEYVEKLSNQKSGAEIRRWSQLKDHVSKLS